MATIYVFPTLTSVVNFHICQIPFGIPKASHGTLTILLMLKVLYQHLRSLAVLMKLYKIYFKVTGIRDLISM